MELENLDKWNNAKLELQSSYNEAMNQLRQDHQRQLEQVVNRGGRHSRTVAPVTKID